ncbi:hypothetical protein RhiirA1_502948 [Rhizophagus irregularis]|uniref:Uncharacterized protein n=1 Tax=Rhizophagus irregularis TaxID=588596 RepID=A0A2I1E0Y8_9GLOM|nr:hypothetical protein RhiirA1_502948 [Rhizophagus irregularis]PKY15789.1 hypothetical protein RhiirB3_381218 [Rhizophagus irregularis]CAB4474624.1 unnamed protein product [Rhizophagus irregularis]CAB5386299.1 unnamed protein product [Rhizophagus irregularis]
MGKKRVRTRKNKKSDKTTNITEEVERIEHDLQDLTLGDTIERNENEPQIQANGIIELDENEDTIYPNNTNITEPDNVETDTRQEDNTIQLTNNRNSFIWNYLEKLSPLEKHKKRARCLVPVIGPEGYEQPCGHVMGTDGSTGNFIYHLTKHRITHDTVERSQDIQNYNGIQYKMANDNPVKKDRLDKKYVGIIIKDNQPLSI